MLDDKHRSLLIALERIAGIWRQIYSDTLRQLKNTWNKSSESFKGSRWRKHLRRESWKQKVLHVPWKARVYISLLAIAAIFALLGYASYGSEFSSNLLAEGVGIVTSVVVGFALVDKLIEMESHRKWERVKRYTLRAIEFRLAEMCFILESSPIYLTADSENSAAASIATDIRAYAEYVANNAQELGGESQKKRVAVEGPTGDPLGLTVLDNSFSYRSEPTEDGGTIYYVSSERVADKLRRQWLDEDSSKQVYETIQPHIRHLRDVLTPRVIEFGYEPELVEALVEAEEAEERWASTIAFIEDDWGMPEEYAWQAASVFFEKCAVIADQISELSNSGIKPSDS